MPHVYPSLEDGNFTAWNEKRPANASSSIRQKLRIRLPLIILLCGILLLLSVIRGRAIDRGSYSDSLIDVMANRGLSVDPSQVIWMEPPEGPFHMRRVFFLAKRNRELNDLYYADVRTAGSSAVLDLLWLTNVTRTSSAAEKVLTRLGPYLAYAVQLGQTYDSLVILDTQGEPKKFVSNWPFYTKLQNAITNLQDSGNWRGLGRYQFHMIPPLQDIKISPQPGSFIIAADGERVVIDPFTQRVLENKQRVQFQPAVKSRPGTITWAVDTVRNISWIGPHFIEWLEHTVFGITDRADRFYYWVFGNDTEAEVHKELAMESYVSEKKELLTSVAPDLNWPPPKLEPSLDSPIRGEGEWIPVVDPNFVNAYPNAPPAFYQTFIRVDEERKYTRVYITLWDPRQVQLNIVMGTREPESATGKTGTGMIPRDPEELKYLVAAFNGGFQALHGEFGMMADGQVYLPPKPWAATIAVFNDGRVGMGSWPGPEHLQWDEEVANQQIPEDMDSMRQNLTSVVEDGKYNPWKRWWWGAAPPWAKEQTYIHRSGICLTNENYFAYFWGESMGPDELGKAMLKARCRRGIHLDMNSKHTGFEFYKPYSPGAQPPDLGRELASSEFQGEFTEVEQKIAFRARKAVTAMTPIRFPRYVRRDPRDYFYLTLRPVLPGKGISVGGKSLSFSTDGLPHKGWPFAFARTEFKEEKGDRSFWFVRIDPSRGVPQQIADEKSSTVLAYLAGVYNRPANRKKTPRRRMKRVMVTQPEPKTIALYAFPKRFGWKYAIGNPGQNARVVLRGVPLSATFTATAAIGVDRDGFLLYGECDADLSNLFPTRMRQAGVREAIALVNGARLTFMVNGNPVSVDGKKTVQVNSDSSLGILAEIRPASEVIFPDVKPIPYRKWGWLQGLRVRYFPTEPPRFQMPEDVE